MSNTPNFYACTVKTVGKDKKTFRTRVGAAWTDEKTGEIEILLDANPVNGRLRLVLPKATKTSDTFEGEVA